MGQARVVAGLQRRRFGVIAVAVAVTVIICCAAVVLELQSRAAAAEGSRRMQATAALAQAYVREETVGLGRLVDAYADRLSVTGALDPGRPAGVRKAGLAESLERLSEARPDI